MKLAPVVGLLGGTFNPVHCGHLRIAIETAQIMGAERIDFIPNAIPPHKENTNILPFWLRVELLRLALDTPGESDSTCPKFRINEIESQRKGPSYTIDTLQTYKQKEPPARYFFILGGEDFSLIHTWQGWRELPYLADIVVIPRGKAGLDRFHSTVRSRWSEAIVLPRPNIPGATALTGAYQLPNGNCLLHLPLPKLEISASTIRQDWLAGLCIRHLTPDAVINKLHDAAPQVAHIWDEKNQNKK